MFIHQGQPLDGAATVSSLSGEEGRKNHLSKALQTAHPLLIALPQAFITAYHWRDEYLVQPHTFTLYKVEI